jgi:hypothetical protein
MNTYSGADYDSILSPCLFRESYRNCIGKGNRRLFVCFLLCCAVFLLFFISLSLSAHYHGLARPTEKAAKESSWVSVQLHYLIIY